MVYVDSKSFFWTVFYTKVKKTKFYQNYLWLIEILRILLKKIIDLKIPLTPTQNPGIYTEI